MPVEEMIKELIVAITVLLMLMFRKHSSAISGFILDEAEVDDNEDDNEDELEEGFSELIAQDRFERDENEDSYSARRRLQHLMDAEEEDKIEEYYRYI